MIHTNMAILCYAMLQEGGGIPRGEFSAGKIPYFNLVRNFPLIFRGEVRNFPHAELCLCKPP